MELPKISGKAWKYGDDINTDVIIPARYMNTHDPKILAAHCMEDLDKDFVKNMKAGDIIVAGKNFGCGSSREQAVSSLKGYELIIVAKNFARIFLQNSCNLGLRTIICPTIEANENDELEITETEIINKSSGKKFAIEPLPKARQAIIDAGGLIAYTRKKLLEKAAH